MKKNTTLFICLIFHLLSFPGLLSAETGSEINIAIKEFPPFVFKELKGFCIDMANIICKKNNLTPKFVRYKSVPEVLAAVESEECHMAFSGITITADRERRVDFSQPFFDSGLAIAVRTEPSSGLAGTYITILKVIGYSVILFLIGLTIVAHIIWFIENYLTSPSSICKEAESTRKFIISGFDGE